MGVENSHVYNNDMFPKHYLQEKALNYLLSIQVYEWMATIFIGRDHCAPGQIAGPDVAIHFIIDSALVSRIVASSKVLPEKDLMCLWMQDSKICCNQ